MILNCRWFIMKREVANPREPHGNNKICTTVEHLNSVDIHSILYKRVEHISQNLAVGKQQLIPIVHKNDRC